MKLFSEGRGMNSSRLGSAHTWIRNNILGMVAIFIALSGSAAAATVVVKDGSKGSAKAKPRRRRRRRLDLRVRLDLRALRGLRGLAGAPAPPEHRGREHCGSTPTRKEPNQGSSAPKTS